MKKNYVAPQVSSLEVPVEGEVFAGSPTLNTFGNPTNVGTGNLGTSSNSAASTFSLREPLSRDVETESNEIYDELFQ